MYERLTIKNKILERTNYFEMLASKAKLVRKYNRLESLGNSKNCKQIPSVNEDMYHYYWIKFKTKVRKSQTLLILDKVCPMNRSCRAEMPLVV